MTLKHLFCKYCNWQGNNTDVLYEIVDGSKRRKCPKCGSLEDSYKKVFESYKIKEK